MSEKVKYDSVNNPSHYTDTNIEVIDYIEDKGYGPGFCIGNAIKYLSRAGRKCDADKTLKEKEMEDLKKAIWYINRRIKQIEKEIENENLH